MYLYSAHFCSTRKALRHGSHSVTCNYTNACIYLVSILQMVPPQTEGCRHLIAAYYSFIDPERLSWPGWLTYSGRFTHVSGLPSAAGRVQDMESLPVKDQRSTTEPHSQLRNDQCSVILHFTFRGNDVIWVHIRSSVEAVTVSYLRWNLNHD